MSRRNSQQGLPSPISPPKSNNSHQSLYIRRHSTISRAPISSTEGTNNDPFFSEVLTPENSEFVSTGIAQLAKEHERRMSLQLTSVPNTSRRNSVAPLNHIHPNTPPSPHPTNNIQLHSDNNDSDSATIDMGRSSRNTSRPTYQYTMNVQQHEMEQLQSSGKLTNNELPRDKHTPRVPKFNLKIAKTPVQRLWLRRDDDSEKMKRKKLIQDRYNGTQNSSRVHQPLGAIIFADNAYGQQVPEEVKNKSRKQSRNEIDEQQNTDYSKYREEYDRRNYMTLSHVRERLLNSRNEDRKKQSASAQIPEGLITNNQQFDQNDDSDIQNLLPEPPIMSKLSKYGAQPIPKSRMGLPKNHSSPNLDGRGSSANGRSPSVFVPPITGLPNSTTTVGPLITTRTSIAAVKKNRLVETDSFVREIQEIEKLNRKRIQSAGTLRKQAVTLVSPANSTLGDHIDDTMTIRLSSRTSSRRSNSRPRTASTPSQQSIHSMSQVGPATTRSISRKRSAGYYNFEYSAPSTARRIEDETYYEDDLESVDRRHYHEDDTYLPSPDMNVGDEEQQVNDIEHDLTPIAVTPLLSSQEPLKLQYDPSQIQFQSVSLPKNANKTTTLKDFLLMAQACNRAGKNRMEGLAHYKLGSKFEEDHELRKASKHYTKFLQVSQALNDETGTCLALNCLGVLYQKSGTGRLLSNGIRPNYSSALNHLRTALDYHTRHWEVADPQGRIVAHINMGLVCRLLGDMDNASENFKSAYNIALDLGDQHGESIALANLGLLGKEQGDVGNAQTLLERHLEIAENMGDGKSSSDALQQLGLLAEQRGEVESALHLFSRARAMAIEYEDHSTANQLKCNIGIVGGNAAFDRLMEQLSLTHKVATELLGKDGSTPDEILPVS